MNKKIKINNEISYKDLGKSKSKAKVYYPQAAGEINGILKKL